MAQPVESNAVELQSEPQAPDSQSQAEDINTEANAQSLAPVDGGKEAWRLLFAGFVFEALLWGFPLSFGVFVEYYSQLPEFKDSAFVSTIGTIASGMAYLAAPLMIFVVKRYARYRKAMIWAGWPVCLLSLVAGSFARSLGALVVTQGFMYGLGFITFYYPILSMLNEFWIARKGMAFGLMCSASGVSGAVFPFAIEAALRKYGYPTTLRAIAIGLFLLTGPLIPMLNGRVPASRSSAVGRTDWSFLKKPTFWVYSASNLMMGFGYFFPALYIPSYATANGMSPTEGAVLLALISVSQVVGQFTFGFPSDQKVPLSFLAGVSTIVSGVAVYTCWGLAHTFPVLAAFSLVYGFFASGYTALWGRMGTAISSEPTGAFAAFGLLNVGKGFGNVLAGPISGLLLRKTVDTRVYGASRYEAIVLFSGSCLALSAAILPLCHAGKLRRVYSGEDELERKEIEKGGGGKARRRQAL